MTESFPRQQARTRRFTLGVPRSCQVSPDGGRVVFLRSRGGGDPVTCLWTLEVASGEERLAADPAPIGQAAGADVPPQERARRERAREQAGGIVAYATDKAVTVAAFALAGEVYLAGLADGGAAPRRLPCRAPAIDPRPDPSGERVAYVCEGALRVTEVASGQDRELAGPSGAAGVSYGLAEFIAAEEMGRLRGYWWAPDGSALLVARTDETPVQRWHIADPADPSRPAAEVAYPAAGTANAAVSLVLVGLDGSTVGVEWDREAFEYLVAVDWGDGGPLVVVQSRDQRRMRLLAVHPGTGSTAVVREDYDGHWLDIVPGVPARTGDGRIVWTTEADGARRLLVATAEELADATATPLTPPDLQVRAVLAADGDTVLLSASQADPADIGVWAYRAGTLARVTAPGAAGGQEPAVQSATRAGGTTVLLSQDLTSTGVRTQVLRDTADGPPQVAATIAAHAETPALPSPAPLLLTAGPGQVRTALLLPSWHQRGSAKLPVLLDPYGGPHAQRVLASRQAFLTSQWFAEQGFAVVVADGRGTPGRGPAWERAVARDLASPVLADQVTALHAAAQACGDLDLARVGIRGWSFGGYLAALAVLRRPDVFHAAVAGAPVTDWRLYDTHYTERYLGHPGTDPAPYQACSLLASAAALARPLLLIHGLADDNVVVAHTLRLSGALLAAGRPHAVLPLTGVTHMTPQEEVAENLLLLQLEFLRRALGAPPPPGPAAG